MGMITVLYVNSFLLGQEIEIKMEDGIPVVYNPKELIPRLSIFDSEGKYVARFAHPEDEMVCVIKKNKVYTIKRDGYDFPLLKRYTMIWE